jgi:hypothetical protein
MLIEAMAGLYQLYLAYIFMPSSCPLVPELSLHDLP